MNTFTLPTVSHPTLEITTASPLIDIRFNWEQELPGKFSTLAFMPSCKSDWIVENHAYAPTPATKVMNIRRVTLITGVTALRIINY